MGGDGIGDLPVGGAELSAAFVRSAEPGRYCDGDGLYLLVRRSGARFWVFRYKLNGSKLHEAGLGRAGEGRNCVRLAEAREKASALFRQVKSGIDPLAARDAASAAARAAAQEAAIKGITFRDAARRYIDGHAATWRNPKHAAQWASTIDAYANPIFGDLAVADVDTAHVLAALEPIWLTKPETASRLRGRIERVLDFAKTRAWRSGENPAAWKGHLSLTLPARSKVRRVGHHAALPWRETGDFMLALRGQAGAGALALRFAILTAARSGEVRGASWREIDLATATWVVPADRMKAGREHRVPLSELALEILRGIASVRMTDNENALVFPGHDVIRPLSDMTLTAVLRRMGRGDLTAHGFRSSFRDWAAETTAYPAELVEMALAHAVGDKVEAAYRRGDLFEKRRRLMEDWADFCATPGLSDTSKVIALRQTLAATK
jgi:integrase